MKIGIITEGRQELFPLDSINKRIKIPKSTIVGTLYASLDPKATPSQIAKAAESRVKILLSNKGVDLIILLVDKENQQKCPGEIAESIESAFKRMGYHNVKAVIKCKMFENWLIADIGAIKKMDSRFSCGQSTINRVVPNKADDIDGLSELKKIVRGKSYDKKKDGHKISTLVDPLEIAKNSRSFRRYLRVLKHPAYRDQSKRP